MKWLDAIKKIDKALNEGANVAVSYRPKYSHNSNDLRYGDVVKITEYEYKGELCKAIQTYGNSLDEGSHTIYEVLIDYFFNTRFEE